LQDHQQSVAEADEEDEVDASQAAQATKPLNLMRPKSAILRGRDKIVAASVRAAEIADFGRIKLSGFVAWAAWLGIHLIFLIGFRNRLLVILQWAWAYVTYQRGARLITGKVEPLMKE